MKPLKTLALLALFGAAPAFGAAALTDLDKQIYQAAHRFRIDPLLVKALIHAESAGDHLAVSKKGAQGLAQIMPGTAEDLGVPNPHHRMSNLMGACQYLRELMNEFKSNLPKVLAAYNAGPHRVHQYGGIPPYKETKHYVRKVLATYQRLKRN